MEAVFSIEDEAEMRGWLEHFVSHALSDAGVWSSPRISDGVSSFRVVEQSSTRVSISGWIWKISQTERAFWVDAEREPNAGAEVSWALYFDSERDVRGRRRNVFYASREPTVVSWGWS